VNLRKLLFEVLSVLLACGLLEILAGFALSRMESLLESLPGLLIMVPPMMDLRGDINGSFASRLGSGIHMGVIDFRSGDEILENLKAVAFLSLAVPALIALFSYSVCSIFGISSMSFFNLLFIAVCTGIVSSMILSALSIIVTYGTFVSGIDPDNVTIPVLATIGDFITISAMFAFAVVVA
jgi:mgtE-like transporter